VGCKAALAPYLPGGGPESIGRVKGFHGNFLVVLRALAYLLTLGRGGVPRAAEQAVLNANYLMSRLRERFQVVNEGPCMHEFVITMEREAKERGVTALDMAKAMVDEHIHPPTMYFPLIVKEALMVEPTETEGKETLDRAADTMLRLYDRAMAEPEGMHRKPETTVIGRPDEVKAARDPVLRWEKGRN